MSDNEISREAVLHMAKLSRLRVDEEELALFVRQFGDIMTHMNKLRSTDTESVEPMYSPLDHFARLRADEARKIRTRAEILANAPETDGETFVVPRIV